MRNQNEMKTTVVHCKKEPFDVYIGRTPQGWNKWANPYTHKDLDKTKAEFQVSTRKEAIESFEKYLHSSGLINDIEELRGKVLGCWCCKKPADGSEKNFLCHGQVIAKYLNSELKTKQKQLI
jgi:hypothetical protein